MARAYASFLLRRWRRGAAGQRVTVEHIQTGEHATLASLEAALAWIRARGNDAVPAAPAAVGEGTAVIGVDGEPEVPMPDSTQTPHLPAARRHRE
jgi:hypothetical protein